MSTATQGTGIVDPVWSNSRPTSRVKLLNRGSRLAPRHLQRLGPDPGKPSDAFNEHGKRRTRTIALQGYAPILTSSPDVRPVTGEAVIDASKLEFASPLDLVGIASLIASSARDASVRLIPPTDPNVANYLLRMDLPSGFDGRVRVDPSFAPETPRDDTPALIEVTSVQDLSAVDVISSRVFRRLERVLPTNTCYQVLQIIGELLENAATHGSSPNGTFLAAQYYTGTSSGMPPGFWIAVADAGIGIRTHLANNPAYKGLTDLDAIRVASQPRVSGTTDTTRGWGLTSVREAAGHAAPGRVVIRSGRAEGWFFVGPAGNTARYRLRTPAISGTWVLALAGTP